MTTNELSTKAEIILDTVHPQYPAARITTFQIYAPRFLLAEINTHRMIAKSAASSRAIPVKKRIEMVEQDPFVPVSFGKNKPGMQADEALAGDEAQYARDQWEMAISDAVLHASRFAALNVHKQTANRILEPFAYCNVVLTGTEWENFFLLRTDPAAQPEFQDLALKMEAKLLYSIPQARNVHLPYVEDHRDPQTKEEGYERIMVSAARCARVSYTTFEGRKSEPAEDIELADRLVAERHMSPFDHQAVPDHIVAMNDQLMWRHPKYHRQFFGWIPYRVQLEKHLGMQGRRDSFAPLKV